MLAVGTAVPLIAQTTPPASPKPPAYEFAWTAPIGDAEPSQLIVSSNTVLLSTSEGLRAFVADSGKQLWAIDLERSAMIAAAGRTVLAITPGQLDALSLDDGQRRWTATLPSDVVTGLLVHKDLAIVTTGSELRAYSSSDGTLAWQQKLDAAAVSVADSGDRIFVGLINHTLITFDAASHARLPDVSLETGPAQLVATKDRILVVGADQALYAYRQGRSGPFAWRVQRALPVGRPVADDRRVYVAQADNTARAYSLGNGTEHWRLKLDDKPLPAVQIAGDRVFFPLLTGTIATATLKARNGQPNGLIHLVESTNEAPTSPQRIQVSGMTPDAGLIFRVTRPSSYRKGAWTLVAVKLKKS